MTEKKEEPSKETLQQTEAIRETTPEPANKAPVPEQTSAPETKPQEQPADSRTYEEGIIAGLQEAILAIMEKNGPVTDQMRRDVYNNTHHDSLITWVKSFR